VNITAARFLAALPERSRADVDRLLRQIVAQADSAADPLGVEIAVYSVGARSAPAAGLSEAEEARVGTIFVPAL
jgi:hypothetical protein